MLRINDIFVYYDNICALRGVSLEVNEGEIVSLIGANGAGKTTTMRTISGLLRPASGTIEFGGQRIDQLPPHEIVSLGIVQVPEGRRVFAEMDVYENLLMGAHTRADVDGVKKDIEMVYELFPVLEERKHQLSATLSGGEQQMLAIGRALMSRPKLLLMDEPSLGLAPQLVRSVFETITEINQRGTTILLVEQNAKLALQVADRAYALETGCIVLHGTGQELLASEQVRKIYLGEE